MAAIARRTALAGLLFAAVSACVRGDEAAELRERLMQVANAVSAGNPSEAISVFSKSYKHYDKLRDYFSALSNGLRVENEVDFLDDPSEEPEPEMNVRWSITIADAEMHYSVQRAAEIKIRFARESKKWKIVDFEPIDLFDPSQQQPAQTTSHSSL